jgi:TldD protein
MKPRAFALAVLLLSSSSVCMAQGQTASPVLHAMQAELTHSLTALKAQPDPPYFLSYEITESHNVTVSGAFGTIENSGDRTVRNLDVDLRVGDYKLDNTHAIRGSGPNFDRGYAFIEVPLEDDPAAIRSVIWYNTDRRYKRAVEQLTKVRTNVQIKVAAEDTSADFCTEPPEHFVQPKVEINVDRKKWEEKIRRYSAPFAKYGDIYEANAFLSVVAETRWYVSSEGVAIQTSQPYYRLFVRAETKADDGMQLPLYRSWFATSEKGLPDDAAVLKEVGQMIAELHTLKTAPLAEPYTGPAILSGRASGVFFHEVFGHRIEGHRQKSEQEGQTFKKMVNQAVLPDFLSVYFDPTETRSGSVELAGTYLYDNQGVKARRVTAVENGVLKNFLMSRSPIDGFPTSNGHGRKQAGFAPVARQSNLIVVSSKKISRAELKKMLIETVKKENKPFGLLFDDIEGGFTMTGRTTPNAFNVLPEVVYRIYPDGREEMVRGVDLIGTPLDVFSRIVATDDQIGIFNGICGAESGGVPVGSSSPGILVSQIEVQRKDKSQERPPVLPAPFPVAP